MQLLLFESGVVQSSSSSTVDQWWLICGNSPAVIALHFANGQLSTSLAATTFAADAGEFYTVEPFCQFANQILPNCFLCVSLCLR